MIIYQAQVEGQMGDRFCQFFPSRIKAEQAVKKWLKEDKEEFLEDWDFNEGEKPIKFEPEMVQRIEFKNDKTTIIEFLLNHEARFAWVTYAGGEPE